MPKSLPDLPWQKVGTDLFEWKRSTYLPIIDYYSCWIDVAMVDFYQILSLHIPAHYLLDTEFQRW